jgi:hypothetical protein
VPKSHCFKLLSFFTFYSKNSFSSSSSSFQAIPPLMMFATTPLGCKFRREKKKRWGQKLNECVKICIASSRKSRRAAAADDLDEGEEAPNLFLQNWRCRKELPIEHFLRLRPLSTNTSAKKHTHTEVLEFKLVKIRQAKHPEVMLERLFDHLLRRLTQGAAELNGQPRLIGLQIANKHMTSPFFVPLRTPAENTAETIAAALVLLNRQSGGRLKLFKTKMICKLSGVWPVGEKG